MEELKIGFTNFLALALNLSQANPVLQTISLILAIAYTGISIYNKIKK
tara:strand:+ start:6694 stop:6837 length:144 start_codon:yes stop_codon:yes gene_type:complete